MTKCLPMFHNTDKSGVRSRSMELKANAFNCERRLIRAWTVNSGTHAKAKDAHRTTCRKIWFDQLNCPNHVALGWTLDNLHIAVLMLRSLRRLRKTCAMFNSGSLYLLFYMTLYHRFICNYQFTFTQIHWSNETSNITPGNFTVGSIFSNHCHILRVFILVSFSAPFPKSLFLHPCTP